jgi:hypothetical protein
MRIAMIPNPGVGILKSDSDYIAVENIINYCGQFHDDMFFYVVLSGSYEGQVGDGDLPRTKFVWLDKEADFMFRHACIDSDFAKYFYVRGGKYLIDCIYSTRLFEGVHISQLLTDYRTSHYVPVVLATIAPWEYGTFSEGRKRPKIQYDCATAMSFALCNPIFYGRRDYLNSQQYVRQCLSPYFQRMFEKTCMYTDIALTIPEMDEIIKSTQKYKKFTLYYGTRFATVKQVDKVMKVYEQLYSSGMDVDIVFTTQTGWRQIAKRKYVQDTLKSGSIRYLITSYDKFRYMREAARGHVFMAASLDENLSSFIFEQIYLGLIGVLPNRPWVLESLPKEYPFLWNNLSEAYGMIKWIYENYEQAKAKINPYRKMINEKYDLPNMMQDLVNHIRKVAQIGIERNREMTGTQSRSRIWKEVQNFVISEYDEDAIRLQSFLKMIDKRFTGFKTALLEKPGGPSRTVPTKILFKNMLEKMGYEDNCQEAEPVFERRRKE